MSPSELLDRFTETELIEQEAYRKLKRSDPYSEEGKWAQLMAATYNCRFGNTKLWSWTDFLPQKTDKKEKAAYDWKLEAKKFAARAQADAIRLTKRSQNG